MLRHRHVFPTLWLILTLAAALLSSLSPPVWAQLGAGWVLTTLGDGGMFNQVLAGPVVC